MGDYVSAALRGLGWYAVLNIVVLHLFVGWKFDKELEEFVIIEYQNDPIPDPPKAIEGLPTQSTVARLLIELEESQTKAKAESSTAKSKVEDVLASYQSTLRNWDYWDDDTTTNDNSSTKNTNTNSTTLLPEGQKPIKIVSFVNLLKRSSLADIKDDDELTASFQVVLREFQGLADHRSEVKWDIITDLLYTNRDSSEFPTKEKVSKEDLYEQVCSLTALKDDDLDSLAELDEEEEDDDEDMDMSLFLSDEDLKMHYQMIEAILEKRSEGSLEDYMKTKYNATIKAARKESIVILQQEVKDAQSLADETIASIQAEEADSGNEIEEEEESKECDVEAVLDTVMSLLETGLDAIQRKKDVRTAILKMLEEIDPLVAKDLTLDNEIDVENLPEMGPNTAINVRKIIDTPLLRHSIVIIDWFLEWARLHTHEVDKLVEKLNLPTTTAPGATTGELLAAYTLQITGTPIPIPPRVHEILLRTERGRHLLTAYS